MVTGLGVDGGHVEHPHGAGDAGLFAAEGGARCACLGVSVCHLICTIFVLSCGVVRGSRGVVASRGPSFLVGYAARWAARVAALRAAWLHLLRGVMPSPVTACRAPVGLQGFGGDAPACPAFLVPRCDLSVADAAANGGGGRA